MFDEIHTKSPLKCKCGASLGTYFQTKDLSCDMMVLKEGSNVVHGGFRDGMSLSKFQNWEVELEEDCNECGGFIRFNVKFDKEGYFSIIPDIYFGEDKFKFLVNDWISV